MKKVILIIAFVLGNTIQLVAQEQHKITIEFSGMKSDTGDIYIALYNSDGSFLKKPFKTSIAKVESKKAIAVFKNIPAGVYAISAFHDRNENKKMDTNFLGIPKEPIGISNNAKGFMGPPKYKDAKFELKHDKTLKINIQ